MGFIKAAMDPVRFADDPSRFSYLQDGLNEVLVHRFAAQSLMTSC